MSKAIIRTSDRQTFKQCRQKWDWGSKIRQNLEPAKQDPNLSFGTAIHAALEKYYEPTTWDLVKNPETRTGVEALATVAFMESLPTEGDDEIDFDRKLLGTGMLNHYFTWAPTVDRFTPIAVEIEFEVPLLVNWSGESRAVYQGRLDMLLEDEFGGKWILDHKTAAQLSGDTDFLIQDQQCGSYCWAIQDQLGIKVEGVIYNELRKDVPHPPAKLQNGTFSKAKNQNTTYEIYLRTLEEAGVSTALYNDILEHLKNQGNKFFRRIQVHRSQTELELLGEQIALEAEDMLSNPRIYPNQTRMNCQRCQFRAPCIAKYDGSDYDWLLMDGYKVRED